MAKLLTPWSPQKASPEVSRLIAWSNDIEDPTDVRFAELKHKLAPLIKNANKTLY